MNENNAFAKSWDFVMTIVNYIFARYADAAGKMGGSFDPWNIKTFVAGLAEMVYLTVVIVFILCLIFQGFKSHPRIHNAVLGAMIILAIVSCIG